MRSSKICAIIGNINRYGDLGELVTRRPPATLPFAGKYRLIDFQLSSIANAGVHDVYFLFWTNEVNSVFNHLGSGKEWGLDTLLSHYYFGLYNDFSNNEIQGLHYYEKILTFLQRSGSKQTVFLGSNMVYNVDLSSLVNIHRHLGKKVTAVFKKVDPKEVALENDLLEITESNFLSRILKKKDLQSQDKAKLLNLSIEIFVIETDWLIEKLKLEIAQKIPQSLQTWITKQLSKEQVATLEYTGYLSNIYDVKSYYDANMDLLNSNRFISLLYSKQKIYTNLKNEVPTYFAKNSAVKNSQISTGSIIEGQVNNSILSRRNKIKEGAEINNSIIFPGVIIDNEAQIDYAIIDKDTIIKPKIKITGTRENPIVIGKDKVINKDIIAS